MTVTVRGVESLVYPQLDQKSVSEILCFASFAYRRQTPRLANRSYGGSGQTDLLIKLQRVRAEPISVKGIYAPKPSRTLDLYDY